MRKYERGKKLKLISKKFVKMEKKSKLPENHLQNKQRRKVQEKNLSLYSKQIQPDKNIEQYIEAVTEDRKTRKGTKRNDDHGEDIISLISVDRIKKSKNINQDSFNEIVIEAKRTTFILINL